jgi:hypothetical protein
MTDAERELEKMREAWLAGVERAPIDALWFCHDNEVLLPEWLAFALSGFALGIAKRDKRGATRFMRYRAVHQAKARGLSWEQSYKAAGEALKGTNARGKPGTMKDDYQYVQRNIREGNHAKYLYWSDKL